MRIIAIGRTMFVLAHILVKETRAAITLRRDVRRVRTGALIDRARRAVERADYAVRQAREDVVRMRKTLAEAIAQRDEALAERDSQRGQFDAAQVDHA